MLIIRYIALKFIYSAIMKSITPEELKSWESDNKGYELVDVREEWEHKNYNIGGRNIPMGELMAQKSTLSKDKPVIIYCEKGIRSVIAIQRLESMGFKNLVNLTGGMTSWRQVIDAT